MNFPRNFTLSHSFAESENSHNFCICSSLQAFLSFSAWKKSRDSTPNSQKLEDMWGAPNCDKIWNSFENKYWSYRWDNLRSFFSIWSHSGKNKQITVPALFNLKLRDRLSEDKTKLKIPSEISSPLEFLYTLKEVRT